MKKVFHQNYAHKETDLDRLIAGFDSSKENVLKENRNTLKTFDLDGEILNIKSFKTPNIFNKIAYKYFRKGKAQRSYEYANKLFKLDIETPQPIAYYQNSGGLFFGRSYYISKHLKYDLTYRELINDFDYPDYDSILRAFTRFTYNLHEKGIRFLDHSPGNSLIVKDNANYKFYLVDLNRMAFGSMNFEMRMKNFARLSPYKSMVEIMSDEYAKHCGEPYEKVFKAMWHEVQAFRSGVKRKKRLKKMLFFWRNT